MEFKIKPYEDLKNDEEFLDIIKRAIKYNSNK
jgi:hypothetical protein